jgi:predicted RNase H-like HicB family nuclease
MVIVASGSAVMRFDYCAIVIEKEPEDEGYSAYSPSLPGCFSNGRTIEEAKRNMQDAIQQHVPSLHARGDRPSAGPAAAACAPRTEPARRGTDS